MKYLMGIDGGGTYSRLLVTDLSGNEIYRNIGNSTNIESNSLETVQNNFRKLFEDFCEIQKCAIDECVSICVGTAGADTEESAVQIEELIRNAGFKNKIQVVNDSVIALAAVTKGEAGIIVISGTGSIGFGMNEQGKKWRVGGFGYLVGDEGSGYWVAREGISAALQAYDHSGPSTCLTEMLMKELKLDKFDKIIDYIYNVNKSEIASLAKLVVLAMEEGDSVANTIINKAADYLSKVVFTISEELDMRDNSFPLIYGGGFLVNTPRLCTDVTKKVRKVFPQLNPVISNKEAEWGALYIASKNAGIKI